MSFVWCYIRVNITDLSTKQNTLQIVLKKMPPILQSGANTSSKAVSRVLFCLRSFYHLSVLYIAAQLKRPTHPDISCEKEASSSAFRTYLVFQLLRFTAIPVARKSRELLPHVFTLTFNKLKAVYSLWHLLSPAGGAFPLGSRMLYVARTFLSPTTSAQR